jgi:spoIIIJ-associated protein
MTAYREYTGKTVEEALRQARDEFGVGLDELDFEILTPGSRGVLGMGAEPARIVAAPRSALGGSAPKREAAEQQPLPPREERPRIEHGDRGDRGDRGHDRPPRRDDRRDERPPMVEQHGPREAPPEPRPRRGPAPAPAARAPGSPAPAPAPRDRRGGAAVSSAEAELVVAARSLSREREELQAAEATPEALAAGQAILERLMELMGFNVDVVVETGETNRLDVVGVDDDEHEALGALIGRKGERLSALQHIVNLMLSREMGAWTRVLVDVEGYRGRRERQLREIALRAADRVKETGKMLQLEPMPALERRWVHLALRGNPDVATQSIGEEPNRRIVLVPRPGS